MALSSVAVAEPRREDYLSTRTTKYGKMGLIEARVIPHPKHDMVLHWDDGQNRQIKEIKIPAGKEVITLQLKCYSGWIATLKANGRLVDMETARSKTGMTRRIGL